MHADLLELNCGDGTIRGVMFVDALAAAAAMDVGRSELDCAAVARGFLPRGTTLVSSPGIADSAYEGDAGAIEKARAEAMEAGYVTRDSDAEARRRSPEEARRYDAMTLRARSTGETPQ